MGTHSGDQVTASALRGGRGVLEGAAGPGTIPQSPHSTSRSPTSSCPGSLGHQGSQHLSGCT